MEGDLKNFTNFVFEGEPKEKNSITLQIPTDESGLEATKTIFDALVLIFNNGMKTLFGNEDGCVDITQLTLNDIKKVGNYFNSFGFELLLDITYPDDGTGNGHNNPPGTCMGYDDNLENCRLILVSNKNNYMYTISFKFGVFN